MNRTFITKCNRCAAEFEIPYEPTPGRPLYCAACEELEKEKIKALAKLIVEDISIQQKDAEIAQRIRQAVAEQSARAFTRRTGELKSAVISLLKGLIQDEKRRKKIEKLMKKLEEQ